MSLPNSAANRVPIKAASAPRVALQDSLFLCFVGFLSLILYVRGLGFYTDDWYFMETLSYSPDRSFFGLFRALYLDHTRPLHVFYLTGIFWLFGAQPLAYHLVNAVAFIASISLFYLALSEVGLPRLLTVAVPLVYALLPHYSTDRFWLGGIQANLSMALYFLSLYANLRTLRARPARSWVWAAWAILSLLGSTLIYEVAVPLFFFNVLLIWYLSPKRREDVSSAKGRVNLLIISNLLALIALIIFKVGTSERITKGGLPRTVHLFSGIISIFYGIDGYGLGFPRMVVRVLRYYPDRLILALGLAVGLLVFGYFYYLTGQLKNPFPKRGAWLLLIASGLVVLGLGYAIFLTTATGFSKTGIVNRTAIAATAGMSMQLVGGLGYLSTFLTSSLLKRISFCGALALLCAAGFVINNTIAKFWVEANRQQKEVLADIHTHFPSLPAGSTLILDGICPSVGPGVVFECHWDLGTALVMLYNDRSLRGDVVSPRLGIGEKGLSTYIYTSVEAGYDVNNRKSFLWPCCPAYPYSEKLFLYNFGQKKIYRLTDADAARRYFKDFNPTQNSVCESTPGFGSWIF